VNVHLGTDGKVRAADVQYKVPGESKFRVSTRPIHKLVLVVPVEEQMMEEAEEQADQENEEEEQVEAGARDLHPPESEDEAGSVEQPEELLEDSGKNEEVIGGEGPRRKEEPKLLAASPPSIPRVTHQESEEDMKDVGQAVKKKRGHFPKSKQGDCIGRRSE
jgi:hypothetical protein